MSTVLVVEDDHILRQMMMLELTEEGYNILTAMNGEEALEHLSSEKPDLILLDLIMPKMDGYTVLKKMKEGKIQCPVLIMSNVSGVEEMEKCRLLGAIDYVVKSNLDNEDFRKTVKKHLLQMKSRS